jgi:hypothetical protein
MTRGVGGRGPANIMKHMKGLSFPADKKSIINNATKALGPDTEMVLEVIGEFPDRIYTSSQEILREFGKRNK